MRRKASCALANMETVILARQMAMWRYRPECRCISVYAIYSLCVCSTS